MKKPSRYRRRRSSPARFFLTALAIAVVIFFIVSWIQRWQGSHQQPRTSTASSATAAIAESQDNLQGFQIFLRRDGCNGGCPYYALMYKKGQLQYVGVRGVKKRGKLTVPVSRPEQKQLLKLVENAAFFNLGNSYQLSDAGCGSTRTDAPKFTVGVTLNGQTKIVKANEACANIPHALRKLAAGIDRVTHSVQWTGSGKAAPQRTAG